MLKNTQTLALVALTLLLGVNQSWAIICMVADPGDIILSDLEGPGDNNFSYPDAFNLYNIASDDSFTSAAQFKWSYYAPAGTVTINGVQPLPAPDISLAVDPIDGATSATQYRIDKHSYDVGDPAPQTVTFRNVALSPIGGPNIDPGVIGLVTTQTTAVTLFVSDSVTACMRTILVYTDNSDTSDRISNGGGLLIRDDDYTTPEGRALWIGGLLGGSGSFGTQVTTPVAQAGMCMTAPLVGNNVIGWFYSVDLGNNAYIPLVKRAVWRARTTVSSDERAITQTPLLDFVYKNEYYVTNSSGQVTGQTGFLSYGGDYVILDNEGGANAPGLRPSGVGRDSYDYWISPIAMLLPQWNGELASDPNTIQQSAFSPSVDNQNDMNPVFRLLDLDAANIQAQLDQGSVCIRHMKIERFSLSTLWNAASPDQSTLTYGTPISATTHSAATLDFEQDINQVLSTSSIDTVNHKVHYKLTGAGGQGSRKTLIPYVQSVPNGDNRQFYPVPWQSNKLYLIEFDAEAETGAGTTDLNPPILIEVNGVVPTTEVIVSQVVISGYPVNSHTPNPADAGNKFYRAGSPRLRSNVGGADQKYVGLYYTQNKTVSPNTDHPDSWAPRAGFFNPASLRSADATIGLDRIQVNSMKAYDLSGRLGSR